MDKDHFEVDKRDRFADRIMDILNGGALALMISIGHRTGLFDTMQGMRPATSEEIARAAGLNERYVREWLGAMVTGGIVMCEPQGPRFYLPAEHACWLTRSATPNNMAVFSQYIPELGAVEDPIVDCFKNGGGVAYSQYRRFHEVMAEDSGQTVVTALIDSILPLVPVLTDDLKRGIDVPGRFDLITAFDAIHDQARPERLLAGIFSALKPGGFFLMQDIAASSEVHKNIDQQGGPKQLRRNRQARADRHCLRGGPGHKKCAHVRLRRQLVLQNTAGPDELQGMCASIEILDAVRPAARRVLISV